MNALHDLISNDYFTLFTGLASVISLFLAIFAVQKVNKISHTNNTIDQKQSGTANQQAGGDIH